MGQLYTCTSTQLSKTPKGPIYTLVCLAFVVFGGLCDLCRFGF